MANHPNRKKNDPARNPSPEEIRAAREASELTQAEAAALLFSSERAWQEWEGGRRRMHPVFWHYFRQQAGI